MHQSSEASSLKKWIILSIIFFAFTITSGAFLVTTNTERVQATHEKTCACGNATADTMNCACGNATERTCLARAPDTCKENSCCSGDPGGKCVGGYVTDSCKSRTPNTCRANSCCSGSPGRADTRNCACNNATPRTCLATAPNTCKSNSCCTGSTGGQCTSWKSTRVCARRAPNTCVSNSCCTGSSRTCQGCYQTDPFTGDRTWNSCCRYVNTCRANSCCTGSRGGNCLAYTTKRTCLARAPNTCKSNSCCTGSTGGQCTSWLPAKPDSRNCACGNAVASTCVSNSCCSGDPGGKCVSGSQWDPCKSTTPNTCKSNSCCTGSTGGQCTSWLPAKADTKNCACNNAKADTKNCACPHTCSNLNGLPCCSYSSCSVNGTYTCDGSCVGSVQTKGTWSCTCSATIPACGDPATGTYSCTCNGGNCGSGDKSGQTCTQNASGACGSDRKCVNGRCVARTKTCPPCQPGEICNTQTGKCQGQAGRIGQDCNCNVCGDCGGTYVISGATTVCSGATPKVTQPHGGSCTSQENNCKKTNTGTYVCGVCNAKTPPNPTDLGKSCCDYLAGCSKQGTIQCDGSCSGDVEVLPPYTCSPECVDSSSSTKQCGQYSGSLQYKQVCTNSGGCRPTTCPVSTTCPLNAGPCSGVRRCSSNACVCPPDKVEKNGVCVPDQCNRTYNTECQGSDLVTIVATCSGVCPPDCVGQESSRQSNSLQCPKPPPCPTSSSSCSGNALVTTTTKCDNTKTSSSITCACGCSSGACLSRTDPGSTCGDPPPDTCTWQNVGSSGPSCNGNNLEQKQPQECGPVGCSGGVCTEGETRDKTLTTLTCPACTPTTNTVNSCQDSDTILQTTTKTTCSGSNCQVQSCYSGTTNTTTSTIDCCAGKTCSNGVCEGTCTTPQQTCAWEPTGTKRDTNTALCFGTNTRKVQPQELYRCGPSTCTGGVCTVNETEWRNAGNVSNQSCTQGTCCKTGVCSASNCTGCTSNSDCSNTQKCLNNKCIDKCSGVTCCQGKTCNSNTGLCEGTCTVNPTCDWITTTTTQQDKTCSNTTTLSTQTQTKQVCGPTNCQGTTNCTKGEEQWINTGTPTTTDCSITNQTCNNGDCITPTCTETTQTTHTCQDTDTILTTIETTCTPQGCTGGSCTPTTQTSTTDCQNNQLCHNGQCLPQCNWTDTGTTRTNNTCTTTTTQTTQQQKEQECGPNNCIGRCTTNKAQGTTQWIDIGTTTTITCPQGQACTTTTCAPLCTWIDNTVSLCLGARTAYLNVSQKCGPDNCQGGVCRKGANRGAGGKIVQCPNGCSNDQCIELCTWEPDTQDTCSDKTTILHTTTNTCGPDNCQRGICTKGTTQIPTTTTTTCPTGQVCKVIGGVGTCTRCTTNTDCPTNQTCTSGICTTPPECIWEDTGTKRIKAGVCATTTAQQEEKEQECGPNNCIGGTCTKGDTQWIDSTIKACIITGNICTNGVCAPPVCVWNTTTTTRTQAICKNNQEQEITTQTQELCGPTNCQAGECTQGTEQWVDTGTPTTNICPNTQTCNTRSGQCETNIQCNWIQGTQTKSCDTNNIRQINTQTQQVCGPPGCTPLQGGCTQGQTQSPTTTTQLCSQSQVCHNGSCITPQPPTLQNNRLDTSITHKETSCRTEQRFTWTPLFNNGATQKTYHLQVATERRFFREYDNARNANQRKTAQDKLTVNFKPRTASSTVRSIPIFTTQQNNKLLFNEITNRGRYNSGHNRTYYARVKVYDTHNQESQWSTIQSFTTPDYPGPKTTIQVPSFVPLGRTFTTTGIIESQHTQKSNLSYEWNIQKNDTSTDVTHNVIQLPITDPPTTIDQEKTKESIQLSLPQETEYTITLTTIDNSLSSHNNTCTTQEDITPGNNQQQFPTYREVPATVE